MTAKAFDLDFNLPTNRWFGYEAALAAAEIESRRDDFRPADFTTAGGYQAAKQLLGRPHERPTAIFAASDEMAIGSILAARDLGLVVPGDVSVIGVDDHELAAFFRAQHRCTVSAAAGRKTVEVLMEGLRPHPESRTGLNINMPFELIVRGSTARPVV
ncbi:substrate-binding domain-containing protein [Cryobacterium serini]|uniref:substrate-binding domain-containing protein n=1 Tax=Cryobacterium serini TaxID=1259201 RepID=UPI001F54262A|nr:substrate-binding domain-containing protein [Cryobacterium serini]